MSKARTVESAEPEPTLWSPGLRIFASILIFGFLILVLLGPLSNPIGSENLTYPMAQAARPLHRILFLGHGYRFFGPDPGPSHIIRYRIRTEQETTIEGQIPDRERHWPRVIYHRWFMLSETLYELYSSTNATDEQIQEIDKQIEVLKTQPENQRQFAQLESIRENLIAQSQGSKAEFERILQRISEDLLKEHNGATIEIKLQERLIPFPDEVRRGARLSDERFLEDVQTFRFESDKLELETLPLQPVSAPEGGCP